MQGIFPSTPAAVVAHAKQRANWTTTYSAPPISSSSWSSRLDHGLSEPLVLETVRLSIQRDRVEIEHQLATGKKYRPRASV